FAAATTGGYRGGLPTPPRRALGALLLGEVLMSLAVQADPAAPDPPLPVAPEVPGRERVAAASGAAPGRGRVRVGVRIVGAALDRDLVAHGPTFQGCSSRVRHGSDRAGHRPGRRVAASVIDRGRPSRQAVFPGTSPGFGRAGSLVLYSRLRVTP